MQVKQISNKEKICADILKFWEQLSCCY